MIFWLPLLALVLMFIWCRVRERRQPKNPGQHKPWTVRHKPRRRQ